MGRICFPLFEFVGREFISTHAGGYIRGFRGVYGGKGPVGFPACLSDGHGWQYIGIHDSVLVGMINR